MLLLKRYVMSVGKALSTMWHWQMADEAALGISKRHRDTMYRIQTKAVRGKSGLLLYLYWTQAASCPTWDLIGPSLESDSTTVLQ